MPLTKEKKKVVLEKVNDAVKSAKSIVFVNFHGLTVAEVTQLRRKLRSEGIGYMVAKKTLAKRALDAAGIEGTLPELTGEFAFAYGEDMLAPSREVYAFQKDHKEHIDIVGGVFEGKYADKELMLSIATIPGREVLYAQFVNLINSPIQQIVVALDKIAEAKSA